MAPAGGLMDAVAVVLLSACAPVKAGAPAGGVVSCTGLEEGSVVPVLVTAWVVME